MFQKPSIANKLICISETCLHPSPMFLIVQIRFAMLKIICLLILLNLKIDMLSFPQQRRMVLFLLYCPLLV